MNRRTTVVVVTAVLVPVGLFLLFWNGFLVFDGPTRSEAARASRDLMSQTLRQAGTPSVLGRDSTFIYSCGRPDGFGPQRYEGGTIVRISGVAPADHKSTAERIDTAGDELAKKLSPHGSWDVFVNWDSPTGTTGEIEASVDCITMPRW